jgi:predicted nucleic acid-binding protein
LNIILLDVNLLVYAKDTVSRLHRPAARSMHEPLSQTEAYESVGAWLDNPQVVVLEPGSRFWPILQEVGSAGQTRGRAWSDAYWAALASKFPGLTLIEL